MSALLDGLEAEQMIAAIEKSGAEAVFPQRIRKVPCEHNTLLHQLRNQIERQFGKLRQCCRIATHSVKTALNDVAFLDVTGMMIRWSNCPQGLGELREREPLGGTLTGRSWRGLTARSLRSAPL